MRRSRLAISCILVTAACAPPPPAPAPVVELRPAPPPPVTAAPTATAAPADPHAPPEVLAKLTADQREELAELGTLCPTAVFTEGGALQVGCTACPNQGGPTPDRRPTTAEPDASRISPHARLRGAFTEKGADERLVVMDSCTCAACFDDAYVLRADAAGDLQVRARASVRANHGCRLVRRPGQADRALCEEFLGRMGYAARTLSLYDFTKPPGERGEELSAGFSFTALDNLVASCITGAAFVGNVLIDWKLGDQDLTAKVSARDGVVSRAAAERECGEGAPLPKAREIELRWTGTPTGFAPTAKTAAELKRLAAARKRAEP